MTGTSPRALRRVTVLTGFAAAAALCAAPMAAGDGPPQGGGGCHMVSSASSTGLDHMMAGSANGNGAANMVEMLSRFSPNPFCG